MIQENIHPHSAGSPAHMAACFCISNLQCKALLSSFLDSTRWQASQTHCTALSPQPIVCLPSLPKVTTTVVWGLDETVAQEGACWTEAAMLTGADKLHQVTVIKSKVHDRNLNHPSSICHPSNYVGIFLSFFFFRLLLMLICTWLR